VLRQRNLRPTRSGRLRPRPPRDVQEEGALTSSLAALCEHLAEKDPSPRRAFLFPSAVARRPASLTSSWSPSPVAAGSRRSSPTHSGRSTRFVASVALAATKGARVGLTGGQSHVATHPRAGRGRDRRPGLPPNG
jgi:hypothetical protein